LVFKKLKEKEFWTKVHPSKIVDWLIYFSVLRITFLFSLVRKQFFEIIIQLFPKYQLFSPIYVSSNLFYFSNPTKPAAVEK
jgi:hypothetical protein